MEKSITSIQMNDAAASLFENNPKSLYSEFVINKATSKSHLQLNSCLHNSSENQLSFKNYYTQTNQFDCSNNKELKPNITTYSNNDQIFHNQKCINDTFLQKIATSLILSQIPKKNINKFFESKFINSFSKTAQQQNTFGNISPIQNIENNDFKHDNSSSSRHRKFSEEEDERLKRIVYTFGPKNWRLIASLMPERTPRQCRDRYSNYLAPGFIHSEWSKEEDQLLAEKYLLFGPKWTQIRQFFPYRTANDIKNRFNYTVSKRIELSQSNKNSSKENQNEKNVISELCAQNDQIEKVSNDFCLNDDVIEINHDMLCMFNDDMQNSDFDFIFMND